MTPARRILVAPSLEDLANEAAALFARGAEEACAARGAFSVALAGGSTPERLYRLLSGEGDPLYRARIPWKRIDWFWGDERHVAPDHAESNYRMACEALLSKVPVRDGSVHRIRAENPDAGAAAEAYEAEIRAHFQPRPGALPRFDLILLGMGSDGHTASLFPGTDVLRVSERWVAAPHVPKLAARRITLTPLVINAAAQVIFLVAGAEKAETLREVLEGPQEPDRLPSQLVRPEAGRLVWLLDRQAASRLEEST